MADRNFPDHVPGEPLPFEEMARIDRLAQSGNEFYFDGADNFSSAGGGGGTVSGSSPRPAFWAMLTDTDDAGSYSWQEVYRAVGATEPNGSSYGGYYGVHDGNDPAREINGNANVPVDGSDGTVVWIVRDEDGFGWTFSYCCDPLSSGSTYDEPVTIPQWTSDQDDYDPPEASTLRVSTDQLRRLTGIVPGTLGGDPAPQLLTIINVGDEPLLITDEDTNSTTTNRILTPLEQALELPPQGIIKLTYDTTLERWVTLHTTAPITAIPQTTTSGTDLDDYPLESGVQDVQITTSADILLTGIEAPEWARTITVENPGTDLLTLTNEDSSSTDINRILTPGGEPLPVPPGGKVGLTYDLVLERWVVTTTTAPVTYPPQTATPGTDQDDFVLEPGTEYVYLTPTANILLTSIVAPVPVWSRVVTFVNTSTTYVVTLTHESTDTAVPGNRFILPGGVPVPLAPGDLARFVYDPIRDRFVLQSTTAPLPDRVASPTISSNTNDLSPGAGVGDLLIDVTSDANLTGIADGYAGRELTLANVGSNTLTLTNDDSASTAGNRFAFSSGDDFELAPLSSIDVFYDDDNDVWRDGMGITAIAEAAAGGGGGTTGTNGSAALGSSYSVTGSFATTGLSVTLPSAGTYLILCNIVSAIDGSQHEYSSFRLYDSTNSVAVGPIGRHELGATTAAQPHTAIVTLHHIIAVAGSTAVRLEANTTTTGTADVLLTSTVLRYVKLA